MKDAPGQPDFSSHKNAQTAQNRQKWMDGLLDGWIVGRTGGG
jgi:hypothetical protein